MYDNVLNNKYRYNEYTLYYSVCVCVFVCMCVWVNAIVYLLMSGYCDIRIIRAQIHICDI